jgi:glutamyl/glutaminyl-tRNA synthetase
MGYYASPGSKCGTKGTRPIFQPIRFAVCGRKNTPPLFAILAVLGRDLCLERIRKAEASLQSLG